jgi:hypothetical protein
MHSLKKKDLKGYEHLIQYCEESLKQSEAEAKKTAIKDLAYSDLKKLRKEKEIDDRTDITINFSQFTSIVKPDIRNKQYNFPKYIAYPLMRAELRLKHLKKVTLSWIDKYNVKPASESVSFRCSSSRSN